MSDDQRPSKGFAPLANVARLMALIDQCQNRDYGLAGMGCFYGKTGRGKTQGAIHASNSRMNVCHIEAVPLGGVKKLLEMIVQELGLKPARLSSDLFDQAAQELAITQRPLIIDEADLVLNDTKIETIRHLHDKSGVAVILMGEERLPHKLTQWERVHRRILNWVEAEPATLQDVGHLAAVYAQGVEIAPDLQQAILTASGASQGYIANNLSNIRNFAVIRGLHRVTRADWTGDFHTGNPPGRGGVQQVDLKETGMARRLKGGK